MLVGNGTRTYGAGPVNYRGAPTGSAGTDRGSWGRPGNLRNFHAGEATVVSGVGISHKSGYPNGYRHPGSWSLPNKAGGLSSFSYVAGAGTLTAAGAMGLNAEADLAGSGAISNALGALVVSAVATLTGSGTISDAAIVGKLEAAATLAGSGALTASLVALGNAIANLTGTGTIVPTVSAIGVLEADLTPFTELSPQSLARAVWESIAAEYADPTTFGGQAGFMYVLAHHKVITDPSTGKMTVFDVDGSTVLFEADLFENAAGTLPYDGGGAERREKFE